MTQSFSTRFDTPFSIVVDEWPWNSRRTVKIIAKISNKNHVLPLQTINLLWSHLYIPSENGIFYAIELNCITSLLSPSDSCSCQRREHLNFGLMKWANSIKSRHPNRTRKEWERRCGHLIRTSNQQHRSNTIRRCHNQSIPI